MPESTFSFQGEEYTFAPERDIGISELRNIKGWFPDLGDYQAFTAAASFGDPDALACLVWIAQRKAGAKRIKDPTNFPDFSIGEVMGSFMSEGVKTVQSVPPFRLTADGKEYSFDIESQLTYKVLKQIKRWYPELGSLVRFTVGVVRGNPDALACLVWIVWGGPTDKSISTPNQIDLAAGGLLDSFDYEEPKLPDEPEPPAALNLNAEEPAIVDPPLPSAGANLSTEIQTSSGPFIPISDSVSVSAQPKLKVAHTSNTSDGSTG